MYGYLLIFHVETAEEILTKLYSYVDFISDLHIFYYLSRRHTRWQRLVLILLGIFTCLQVGNFGGKWRGTFGGGGGRSSCNNILYELQYSQATRAEGAHNSQFVLYVYSKTTISSLCIASPSYLTFFSKSFKYLQTVDSFKILQLQACIPFFSSTWLIFK